MRAPGDTTLTTTPAWRIAEMVRAQEISAEEIAGHFLERITRLDPQLNAFITVAAEQALEAARMVDASQHQGLLAGVPIGIKDLTATKGIRTTYGSLLHAERVPDADDISVERIRSAGAVITGKTNVPEFGLRATTENRLGDPCRNPWDVSRTSGGSSGGSGAALAARLVPLATGSDAGGSIRIPASFCGVYGIKPTFGRVPSDYQRPGGWRRLSQNGPMANTVRDAAVLLTVQAGGDERDALSLRDAPPDFVEAASTPDVRGLRIAVSPDVDDTPTSPEVRRAVLDTAEKLLALGASIDEVAPDVSSEEAMDTMMTLLLTDAAVELGPALDQGLGPHMTETAVEWVSKAMTWPVARYATALRRMEWHNRRIADLFEHFDLWLLPTMAVPPFPTGEPPSVIDGRDVDPLWHFTPFCMHANLTGRPAASVPGGFSTDGLPIGVQLVGRLGDEAAVLRASAALEQASPWAERLPPIA